MVRADLAASGVSFALDTDKERDPYQHEEKHAARRIVTQDRCDNGIRTLGAQGALLAAAQGTESPEGSTGAGRRPALTERSLPAAMQAVRAKSLTRKFVACAAASRFTVAGLICEHRSTAGFIGGRGKGYPSDLRDAEWARLEPLIPQALPGGRPRKSDMRAAMNCILYLLRTGCPWRYLPRDGVPPRSTVDNIFRKFRREGCGRRSGPNCTWRCASR
jgi:Putative transposase of IS4/5 family (DUF4096)